MGEGNQRRRGIAEVATATGTRDAHVHVPGDGATERSDLAGPPAGVSLMCTGWEEL